MTKEQAEKILDPETSRDAPLKYECEERIEAVNEACMVAVSALRAQQAKLDRNRWEGCVNCATTRSKQARKNLGYQYCEHCGRPLTEEALAELERRINGGTTD